MIYYLKKNIFAKLLLSPAAVYQVRLIYCILRSMFKPDLLVCSILYYILGLTQLGLNAAQQYCLDRCGTLAEPNLTQNDIQIFSNEFHTQFADEITTSI